MNEAYIPRGYHGRGMGESPRRMAQHSCEKTHHRREVKAAEILDGDEGCRIIVQLPSSSWS